MMDGGPVRTLRWVLIALMLCALALLVSSPALAEVTPLPLDQTVPGQPAIEENWKLIPGSEALQDEFVLSFGTAQPYVLKYAKDGSWAPTDQEATVSKFDWHYYEDESISVRCEYATLIPAFKAKKIQSSVTYIRVADPSQVRTAMSYDNYKKGGFVEAADMAVHKNAIAAVNGDFFKYHGKVGYVLRQGEFYRDKLNGKRDLLIIDDQGNFRAVYAATSAAAAEYLAAMEAEGRSAVNTFTLGPVLVENGQARVIAETCVSSSGEFQWKYAQQRVAVVQVGPLQYAIVEAYGKTDGSMGMTIQEFSDYIAYLFPDCLMAYNLDGGGSTNVVLKNARIHVTPGHRQISDILYFASARQVD